MAKKQSKEDLDSLEEYCAYPNVGIKKNVYDEAVKSEKNAFNDFREKTDKELQYIQQCGGIPAYAAKVELQNRSKMGKFKGFLSLIFLLIFGILCIWEFVALILNQ